MLSRRSRRHQLRPTLLTAGHAQPPVPPVPPVPPPPAAAPPSPLAIAGVPAIPPPPPPPAAGEPAPNIGTLSLAAIELKSLLHLPDTHAKPASHCVLRWQAWPLLLVGSEQPVSPIAQSSRHAARERMLDSVAQNAPARMNAYSTTAKTAPSSTA
jgi:hypothetical protein